MLTTSTPVDFELRRHHRIRPVDVHATMVSESVTAGRGRVQDLSVGGMLVEHAPVMRPGERVWSRLWSCGQSWFGIPGKVVRHDRRGIAVQFASLESPMLERLEKLVFHEHVRSTETMAIIAHRTLTEGRILVSMLTRAGIPAVHVRTPLELIAMIEGNRQTASALLVDEFFWGSDLDANSRLLAELYPELEMSLLLRSCSQAEMPQNVFQHVARKPWHIADLQRMVRAARSVDAICARPAVE